MSKTEKKYILAIDHGTSGPTFSISISSSFFSVTFTSLVSEIQLGNSHYNLLFP